MSNKLSYQTKHRLQSHSNACQTIYCCIALTLGFSQSIPIYVKHVGPVVSRTFKNTGLYMCRHYSICCNAFIFGLLHDVFICSEYILYRVGGTC
jgi:hypothetical protein